MHCFVFGSNMAGKHGRGAAKAALDQWGAIRGRGVGIQGTGPRGTSYAIPTKDADLKVLPLPEIELHVQDFLRFASSQPSWVFWLTPIGTGLARYSHAEIAPMFAAAPANIRLPLSFKMHLTNKAS